MRAHHHRIGSGRARSELNASSARTIPEGSRCASCFARTGPGKARCKPPLSYGLAAVVASLAEVSAQAGLGPADPSARIAAWKKPAPRSHLGAHSGWEHGASLRRSASHSSALSCYRSRVPCSRSNRSKRARSPRLRPSPGCAAAAPCFLGFTRIAASFVRPERPIHHGRRSAQQTPRS